ncbi:hypothetical protein P3X46_011503 [Hevea brasiliensis]|uniref:DUF4005 domain-containing protein n=1 Tax=Hevea brasiliensis TaxID=3981 RepID=A0ABQ9M7A5_HEVBR|nr:hypothetical protein P3X46_011503 [Hevea brasiliensis]
METSHKGRGLFRGKLAKAKAFLRVNSKPCMAGHCSSNKVSPNPCGPNGSGDIPSRQRHANPPSIQRVSSAQPSSMPLQYSSKVSPSPYTPYYSSFDFPHTQPIQKVSPAQKRSFHDYGVDENVDMKTASYISYVRESFKVEKVDSEA